MKTVKLVFLEKDNFIPERGSEFQFENQTYYIHEFKLLDQRLKQTEWELGLSLNKPLINPGDTNPQLLRDCEDYLRFEEAQIKSRSYTMASDYNENEIARRAYLAGASRKSV